MNLHHLELFHHVCVHGGITAAAKKMTYGIQQPAMSIQLLRLEQELGVKLFDRKPFRLTEEGERLHAATASFFHQTTRLKDVVMGRENEEVRVAGASEFLANHVPALISKLRQKRPGFRVRLYERRFDEAIPMLERHEVDLVVTVPEGDIPVGVHHKTLTQLPLLLLVPSSFRGDVESLFKTTAEKRPSLISLPQDEVLTQLFFETLHRKGNGWPVSIEVTSLGLIERYVAEGMGVGLSVRVPHQKLAAGVKALELKEFPKIQVVGYWRSGLSKAAQAFVQALQERAQSLSKGK
ncbi:MAG: LysR family transcriptional regulator [Verrucomicrobiota bacterium]